MNEILTIFQLIKHIAPLYLGIGGLFILLLITRGNFNQPSNLTHKSYTPLFVVFIFLFAVIPTVYFGWGFYQAYHPDYKYDAIASELNFHIYQPSYLPNNVQQETAYATTDKPLFTDSPTVNAVFATRMKDTFSETNNQLIILMQSKAPSDFALLPYIEQRDETSAPLIEIPTAISITSFPGTTAYLVQQELLNQVWLLTKDNVLIVLTSPVKSTSAEELTKIIESLH